MAGHVFVVRGDLMQIACDAWLVPGGAGGPGSTWRAVLPKRKGWHVPPAGWSDVERSVLLASVDPPEPLPFLTDITGNNRDSPEWWVEGARRFVRLAARTLADTKRAPVFGRSKHLLAMPLLGTGGGGGGPFSGEVIRLLLHAMREESAQADVDIAVVLNDGPAWAAAQNQRSDADWAELPAPMRQAADDLAAKARNGDLVLFLGAGVSQGAGLPSWSTLLSVLAADRGRIASPAEQEALARLGELDRAALIKKRLRLDDADGATGADVDARLGRAVSVLLRERGTRHALTHGLLASLPVEEVITTNYDDLFERASAAVDRPCTVLPWGEVLRERRWLLKMHGCVTRPESIVLTREDYLKYQESRSALAGIVQALLLTRHMLFVGFSFTDDNFHRIAHAVRQSLRQSAAPGPQARTRFGTTVVVGSNPLAEELWGDDLAWRSFEGTIPEQVRLLEIFLDRLARQAATATSHLGDRRYDAVLAPGERSLRDRLEGFLDSASEQERQTGAWAEVESLMRRLGIHRPVQPRDRLPPP